MNTTACSTIEISIAARLEAECANPAEGAARGDVGPAFAAQRIEAGDYSVRVPQRSHHEIGFYFLMHLPPDSPLREQTSFVGHEGDMNVHFEWIPVATLEDVVLYPTFLRTGLKSLPTATTHIIHVDSD